MDQRVTLVTLGVADLVRAKSFYTALGWTPATDMDEVVFFQTGGSILGLWSRASLAEDGRVTDGGGWGGITLSHNVGSPADVDRVIDEARAAGAVIAHEPEATLWGGYSGIFHDPDGHVWEVAHNPGWELGADGSITIPAP